MTKRQTKKVDSNSYLYSDIKKRNFFERCFYLQAISTELTLKGRSKDYFKLMVNEGV